MKTILFVLAVTLLVVAGVSASGQSTGSSRSDADSRFMPVEDIKPGMKGIARTVFAGSQPEEFGIEVLGVLPGYPAPRQSAIIIKLSGANAERTGVFAGMSGSPVFID